MSDIQVKPRRPWLAGLLSLLVMGLGQLYSGRLGRALAVYLGEIALMVGLLLSGLPKTFAGLIILVLTLVLYSVWVIWDAVLIARRSGDYSLKRFNRWYVYLAVWLLAAFLIVPCVLALSPVKTFWIPSRSMEPALLVGDHLVADLTHYRSARPARGDIALMLRPDNPAYVVTERVIGLEGEEIEIRQKSVLVNGRPLRDPWGRHNDASFYPPSNPLGRRDNFGPLKIPASMVFVLGDNRDNSYDSRFYGPVPTASLKGRPLYLYWARDKSRIGRSLR
jgi:signal peptidase I